jgi:hypothetical protein
MNTYLSVLSVVPSIYIRNDPDILRYTVFEVDKGL